MNEEFIEEILSSHPLLINSFSFLQKISNEKVVWDEQKVNDFVNTQPDAKYSLINLLRNSKNLHK